MANPDHSNVVVTGTGAVTSVGVGNDAVWASLAAGRSNVQPRTLQIDMAQSSEFPLAAMPPTDELAGVAPHIEYLEGQECRPYRDLAYTLHAIELALADAGITYDRDKNNIGVIQAFESPGSEHVVKCLFQMNPAPPTDGPPRVYEQLAPLFYASQPFLYVHLASKALGLHGFATSVHNACTSGAYAIEMAAQQIREGVADVMIVAGGEAFETGVRTEWFRRLGVYADDGLARPFDSGSGGLCVGEGAGAIVLESASHAGKRGVDPYASYLGGAFACQGWKQTIPDVRSARLRDAIVRVMKNANVSPEELDLIVPHGAGTALSDRYEGMCLVQADCGKNDGVLVTAFKPYVGHMLAASAVIETVCSLLAMRHNAVPATLNSRPEHVKLDLPLANRLTERPIRTLLKLSTGFTGHDAALLFRK